MSPALSIVVPTVGRIERLTRLLKRLEPQLQPADELWLVDNGRDPLKATMLPAGPHRIERIAPRSGPGLTRNMGAMRATKEILVFLDDDDLPCPTYLDEVRTLFANGEVHAAYPALIEHGALVTEHDVALRGNRGVAHALAGGAGFGGNVSVRAEAFWGVGGFRSALPASQDRALAIDLLDGGYNVVALVAAWIDVDDAPRASVGRSLGAGVRRLPFLATYFDRIPRRRRGKLVLDAFATTLTTREPAWSAGILLATFPAGLSKLVRAVRRRRSRDTRA